VADVNRSVRVRRYEIQAEGYLELGVPEEALRTLARLGQEAGLGAHALYLQGEALRSLERYEEALAPLGQAATLSPQSVHLWLAIGWCRKRTGRIDLAIEAMERAVAIDAEDALNHYNLACYLSLNGQKDRALAHLARALKIDPGYRNLVDDERDFDPLRSDPDFRALTSIIV
jgi:tetratricopeptide (TPR) repeat protein